MAHLQKFHAKREAHGEINVGLGDMLVQTFEKNRHPNRDEKSQRENFQGRPSLNILALAFLVTIGVTIFLEGMQQHVAKAYIYLPMGFALCVELLQMRHDVNRKRLAGMRGEGIEPPTNSV